MILADATQDQQRMVAFMIPVIFVTLMTLGYLIVKMLQARDKYGMLPRGFRWIETLAPAMKRRGVSAVQRVFYGDVIREREAEKLIREREDGMTPWWNDTTKTWVKGDVEAVSNQHGFVIARRPSDYVNRVATPGVDWKKELEA